jgi:hypothetical protein
VIGQIFRDGQAAFDAVFIGSEQFNTDMAREIDTIRKCLQITGGQAL